MEAGKLFDNIDFRSKVPKRSIYNVNSKDKHPYQN